MALTSKLGIVSHIKVINGYIDHKSVEAANRKLFEYVRSSGRFPISPGTKILDIGCASDGSDFIEGYIRNFPGVEAYYLSINPDVIKRLKFPNKVVADAAAMPFDDEIFDLAYAGGIFPYGVSKNIPDFAVFYYGEEAGKDHPYKIAKEAYRVLKKNGLFVFDYAGEETFVNLTEIGFIELELVQTQHILKLYQYLISARK